MQIIDSKILDNSIDQLFDVVLDIDNYKNFLPFCSSSKVIEHDVVNNKITADLTIKFKKIEVTYHSIVTYVKKSEMYFISIVSNSNEIFDHMRADWHFTSENVNSTMVEVEIDCAIKSFILGSIFQNSFKIAYSQIMQAFENRAKELYG